jgi:hypothetical protein
MAHQVSAKLHTKIVAQDLEVAVRNSSGMLGTLFISKGNIEWQPTRNTVNRKRMKWEDFAVVFEEKGKDVRAKKAPKKQFAIKAAPKRK